MSLHCTTLLLTLQYTLYSSRIITRHILRSQSSKELHMLRVEDGFNNKLTADFLKILFFQGNGTLVWRYETANTKDAAALRPKRGTAGISLPVDTSRIAAQTVVIHWTQKKLPLKVKCKTAHSSSPNIGNV